MSLAAAKLTTRPLSIFNSTLQELIINQTEMLASAALAEVTLTRLDEMLTLLTQVRADVLKLRVDGELSLQ